MSAEKKVKTIVPKETLTLVKEFNIKTGLVYDARLLGHDNYKQLFEHPENPLRIVKIYKILEKTGCLEKMIRIPCREIDDFELKLFHNIEHIKEMRYTEELPRSDLMEMSDSGDSVYYNGNTNFCARLSCGGVVELLKEIAVNNVRNGFAVVRPPGHHAKKERAMGFCFFNNVAIGVKRMTKTFGIQKVMILDWDVHHGNGVEEAFIDDPNVLYISLHRYMENFFPQTGHTSVIGQGAGVGKNVNIAFTGIGMGDSEYLYAFNHIVMPMGQEFNPDLVVVSAGFDAAKGDPLGEFNITPAGYAHMTYMLKSLAKGKLAVCLEGGYNPDVIARSAFAVTKILMGGRPEPLKYSIPSDIAKMAVDEVAKHHFSYWKCLDSYAELFKKD